ncbi:MAG TPA: tRNA lysidine(34) synthetase TilS, partial [Thermoplasmatales archaeon]|nr:tRNA lysidine(34) synthetase TilS [Thermoplasmatales archaeon]
MVVACSKCSNPAVIFLRYNGTHLCRKHFSEYVDRRVKREVRKQRGNRRFKR